MTPEQGTKLVEALTALLWAALAGWLLFMLRASLARHPDRISGVEPPAWSGRARHLEPEAQAHVRAPA
jgi:hypothetical protein